MKTKNPFAMERVKLVDFRTANNEGKMVIEYGANRHFSPSFYNGQESLYIVMSEYVQVNGQPMPLTMDYYGPNGNFRLHSSLSGTTVNPDQLVQGKRFKVRDVGHAELVSRQGDLASLTVEVMSIIDLIRSGDHAGLRAYL